MRYLMQPWLIYLGSMAWIKVDLWGRFLSPCVNFSFEKLKFPRREEGRVKLDNASWMPFTDCRSSVQHSSNVSIINILKKSALFFVNVLMVVAKVPFAPRINLN